MLHYQTNMEHKFSTTMDGTFICDFDIINDEIIINEPNQILCQNIMHCLRTDESPIIDSKLFKLSKIDFKFMNIKIKNKIFL